MLTYVTSCVIMLHEVRDMRHISNDVPKKRLTATLTFSEAYYVKRFIYLLRDRPDLIEHFQKQDFPFKPLLDDLKKS